MKIEKLVDRFKNQYNIDVYGNIELSIDGLNLCNRDSEKESVLSYVTTGNYSEYVSNKKYIKALIVKPDYFEVYKDIIFEREGVLLISDKAEELFYDFHEWLFNDTNFYHKFDFEPKIGSNCDISPNAVIENGVTIGDNVSIGHGSIIKAGSVLADNVKIGCNTVVGSEGFQILLNDDKIQKASHVGGCYLDKNVFVGDNCCVCNCLFEGNTYIGENAKIDNLVHVAHNVRIEKNAVVTAHTILCGSSIIGEGAWIAPNVSVLNRVRVGNGAKVGMGSVVVRDVPDGTLVYGSPAKEHK